MILQRIKQIVGLILLLAFLSYLGYKLFSSVDFMLALLLLVVIIFMSALVLYVLSK